MTSALEKIDLPFSSSSIAQSFSYSPSSTLNEEIQKDLEVTWHVSLEGKTKLHEAVEREDLLAVQKWVAQCPFWVNQQDQSGKTPLFYVRSLEIWKTLRSNGAKWSIPDQRGKTVWDRIATKFNRRKCYGQFVLDMIYSDEFRKRRDQAQLLGQLPLIYSMHSHFLQPLALCLAKEGLFGKTHLRNLQASPYSHSSPNAQKVDVSFFLRQIFSTNQFDLIGFLRSLDEDMRKKLSHVPYLAVLMEKFDLLSPLKQAGFSISGVKNYEKTFQDKKLRAICACFDLAKTDGEKYEFARLFSKNKPSQPSAAYRKQSISLLRQLNQPRIWEETLRSFPVGYHDQSSIAWVHQHQEAWTLELHQRFAKRLLSHFVYDEEVEQQELKKYLLFVIEKSKGESLSDIQDVLVDRLSAMRGRLIPKTLLFCLDFLRAIAQRKEALGDLKEGNKSEKASSLFIQILLPILSGWKEGSIVNCLKQFSVDELHFFVYHLYFGSSFLSDSFLQRTVLLIFPECLRKIKLPMLDDFSSLFSIPGGLLPLFLLVARRNWREKSRVDLLAALFEVLGESKYTKSLLGLLSSEELTLLFREYPQSIAGVSFFSFGEKREQYESLHKFIGLQNQLSRESKLHLRQWLRQWDFSTESHLGWIFRYLPVLRDSDFELEGFPTKWAILLNLAKRHPEVADGILSTNRPTVERLQSPFASQVIRNLFEKPKQWAPILEALLRTKELSVGVDQHAYSTFGDFADWLLKAIKKPFLNLPEPLKREQEILTTAYKKELSVKQIQPCEAPLVHSKGVQILGRTVVYPDIEGKGWTAYKFRRAGEPVSEFAREFFITKALEQCDFPSELPQFEEFLWIEHCPSWIREKVQDLPQSDSQLVLRFHAPSGYYNYLNEIKDEETWRKGREKWLKTQAKKIRLGFSPIEAPLYHGRGRHYEPLTDLMRTQGLRSTHRHDGSGFVLDQEKQVQHPNCGETGARDHGDLYHIEDLLKKEELQSRDVRAGTDEVYREPFILLSVPAKTLLVDVLLVMNRFKKMGRFDWRDEKFVEEIAKAFQEGQAWFIQELTGRSKEECDRFSKEGPIHWKQMARQLLFWLNRGEGGYVPYLRSKEVPEGLYDSDTRVSINIREGDYDENGFVVKDGEESLGCQHGSILAVELEKYLMLTALVVHGL